MKRFLKWLMGSLVVLVLAGLAVLQLLAVFSGVTGIQLGKNSILQPIADESQARKGVFEIPVRHPESARSVRISVMPISSRMMTAKNEMTDAERAVKQQLENLLTSGESTHRLVYDGVKTIFGRLVEEYPDHIVFAQKYGESGEMSIQLPRSRIVLLEACSASQPVISRRDILFYMEFPGKQFYKSPPYTVMTDESFFAVEHIIKQLQDLYGQITEQFSSLIASSGRRDDVQLLISSSTREYEAYRNRYAPGLKGSSGFYSHGNDRMTVYHQRDADWVKNGKKQIAAVEKQYEGESRSDLARESFNQWKINAKGELLGEANKVTQTVIRHEGAHQLLFTLGVQNSFQTGRDWVTEGLATYCETTKPGRLNASRIEELKTARAGGLLIPLRTLMTASCNGNSLAYAEAWSLTHMLMQPEYRSGFFSYLEWIRNNPVTPVSNSIQELCRFVSLDPDEFESRWMVYINQLVLR